jgi:hypothetical protein
LYVPHLEEFLEAHQATFWREQNCRMARGCKALVKLCKNSDTTAITSFDSDWSSFVTYIKENGNMEKFNNNKKTWLDGLRDLAPKWAACYTWQHQSYGIHLTQCAEAANSAIASFCSKSSKILTITDDLEQLADARLAK